MPATEDNPFAAAHEAFAKLTELFCNDKPIPRGKSLLSAGMIRYDLVRLEDGSIGFVRDPFGAEFAAAFKKAMAELFPGERLEDD